MRKRWMMQISVLVLLAATVFSTGVTFADTGNTSSGSFQERVQDRLNAAVADGKITAEEATEKLARLQERLSNMKEKMQFRLDSAVSEGKITEEEAAERINRFDERGPRKFTFIGRDALQDRLNATVADGKITAEEAAEKLAKFEERINQKRAGLQDRLNAAVAEGKITEEQAAKKLTNFEDWVVSGGKVKNDGKGHKGGFIGRDALQDRLNTAVAEGNITEEEAAEKLAKFEERVSEIRVKLQDRLNAAVADGKITTEEAAEKLAKFEEIVDSGGKFRGPRFGHSGGNGQSNNVNNAVYQGV
ncbi:MAG: hypothetical protein FI729_03900 [SAR202 cluster bacterium]|nr:hypothetical protein [SAR202 cluster bacterium]|tara:strand:+ start:1886 stop:2794 length:909 start_codon:yes stop_codon:yes gene_type:complete